MNEEDNTMIINELRKLESLIKKGEWKPKADMQLWGGADVIISEKLTDELAAWELDNHLIIDGNGLKQTTRTLVISRNAKQISNLFYELKDIFREYIDFANKYTFYGRLAKRAKFYIEKKDDLGVLLEIIEEALLMANELNVLDDRLYFAYGSNMDEEQMAKRCPEAKLIGKGRLNGYRFIINGRGVASVVNQQGRSVEGLLWRITSGNEEALDYYEGVSFNTYFKKDITIDRYKDDETYSALIYIASESSIGKPRSGYLERIITAAEKHEFDSDYLKELKKWLKQN